MTKFSICAATVACMRYICGNVINHPIKVSVGVEIGALERVAAQVEDQREPQLHQRLRPGHHTDRALHGQVELIVADPDRHDFAVVAEVHDGVSRALLRRAGHVGNHVVAVEMDLEGLARRPCSH